MLDDEWLKRVFDSSQWIYRLENINDFANGFMIATNDWLFVNSVNIVQLLPNDHLFYVANTEVAPGAGNELDLLNKAEVLSTMKKHSKNWRAYEIPQVSHQMIDLGASSNPEEKKVLITFSFAKDSVCFFSCNLISNEIDNLLIYTKFVSNFLSLFVGSKTNRVKTNLEPGMQKFGEQSLELTPRQFSIALLIAQGKINREIAEELGYSESLIRKETMTIFIHYKVRKREELISRIHLA
jgi:DNA-binding CsgD family transcriptional regulator